MWGRLDVTTMIWSRKVWTTHGLQECLSVEGACLSLPFHLTLPRVGPEDDRGQKVSFLKVNKHQLDGANITWPVTEGNKTPQKKPSPQVCPAVKLLHRDFLNWRGLRSPLRLVWYPSLALSKLNRMSSGGRGKTKSIINLHKMAALRNEASPQWFLPDPSSLRRNWNYPSVCSKKEVE